MSTIASLLIGGDCGPVHGDADGYPITGYTELVRPVLEKADVRFVNCMRTYSKLGVQNDTSRISALAKYQAGSSSMASS